ncbi:MAG: hypothetical protein CMB56_002095 [Methanobacteriota archaeon]|nr:MAG: hypothetical protein CMB56_002095 [Euryarchaeota archaeon]
MEVTSASALLLAAITLGFIEGIKPGPLMTVVISETMIHDWKAGLKVALVPLITDGPVILLSVILYEILTLNTLAQALIGFLGSIILIWLGIDCFKKSNKKFENTTVKSNSLRNGIITNLSNPNMYLYWMLIGAPFLINAFNIDFSYPFIFVFAFFSAFILLKMCVAILVEKSKDFLNSSGYKILLQLSGVALLSFSCLFVIDSLKILKVI